MKYFILSLALICLFSAPAKAASADEQRVNIQKMQHAVLNQLYNAKPGVQQEIDRAAGYAVFSSADVAAIFFSGSYGHGIAHDNSNDDDTYMQMASAGIGFGLGVKDFRVVFVFNDQRAFRNFVDTGLDLSGHVDLAVKQGDKGGAITGAEDILPGVRVYQVTDTGLLAQVMLKGTRYWRDGELNENDRSTDASSSLRYNR